MLRRNSHRIHRIHRSLLLRRNSHRFHGFTQMQANCSVNSVNSVGVFTLYKYLCGSVQSVGEYPLPVCSVCSVKSVGASLRLRGRSLLLKRKLPRNSRNTQKFIVEKKLPQISRIYTDVSKMFCVFREICGSKYLCKSVKSVGEYSLPVCSVNSVNSVGVLFWLRGYGIPAIPTQPLTSRGCSCLSCTNKADGIHLPDWCTSCSVSTLLALASGKAERRQVHPLKIASALCQT